MVALTDLVGVYKLTGVSFSLKARPEASYAHSPANVCAFVLDGKTYSAIEDENDGYRSALGELLEDGECTNMFPVPCYVICRHMERDEHNMLCDTLVMTDIFTGQVVLEVGTDNSDDYYPSFVNSFHPEAMASNMYKV